MFRKRPEPEAAPPPPAPAPPVRRGLPALFKRTPPPPPQPEAHPEPGAGDLRPFWPKFWTTLGRIPFAEDLAAAWYCWADPKTPTHVKAALAGALAYFVVPTDLLPDFLAGLGFTDDAAVLATAISMAGVHVRKRHKQAARRLLRKGESGGEA